MKETSVGAIVYRNDGGNYRYLLLHYTSGHWDYVKGHIEGVETEEETLFREAEEEGGLTDLKLVDGFREEIKYFFKRNGNTIEKDVVFLLAETKVSEKDIKICSEHTGYLWLGFKEAVSKVTYENSKKVLKKADKFLNRSS
jgi:bis(5'-nucleosidyl)-tetraphosphatase